jgi:predicted lipoprotein
MTPAPRILALSALALASCVPWTTRPIAGEARPPAADPVAYVDSIWSSKLVPSVLNTAVDARELLDALSASPAAFDKYCKHDSGPGGYCTVKGEGVVTAVDTRSRAGLALIDIAPFDGRADLSIQIGPVLTGNALRDSTGVVNFSDFVNQLQFADAGNEINNRVLKHVLAPIDPSRLKGKTIAFAGALQTRAGSDPPLAGLIPVMLAIRERP